MTLRLPRPGQRVCCCELPFYCLPTASKPHACEIDFLKTIHAFEKLQFTHAAFYAVGFCMLSEVPCYNSI